MQKNIEYLNVKQAAKFIGISRQTFYEWVEGVKGFPEPVVKIGNRDTVLYDKNDIKLLKRRWRAQKKTFSAGWRR